MAQAIERLLATPKTMPVLPSSRPIRGTSRTHASLAHGSTGGKPPALYCRPMTPNHVKQRLAAGKACFGSLLNFGDPLVAELMASVGFDWLLVDTEHGPIDLATLATMFATITRYPCAPFVRVHALDEENVKRVLDAGAWGVLAPNIRTREEAELLVRACKYPPEGVRSLGAGRFALSFKTDAPTYFQRANDEILVIAQIEHVDAVANIDAILSVPGVDACYVGPNDWCASAGLPPSLEPPYPEFEAAMQTVLAAARRHGVAAGIHSLQPETVNRRIREGWRLVGMVNDQRFLFGAAKAARDAVKTDV
ncbi:MAG: 2-dehydro-3-deoxyglucarate aldolase [Candidatus Rokuibacteriota bacterium]|nr:MAG: 2-dehydro-3-deoxyglucarate aldolase [Candidatus Rokubacteria bacterium]PYM62610.1 MAG: 2-dehydro-3-deoxyglucarate aldolase [Candidatus Rokubacteria bacterium]PYN68683.1 MAG: 2-dehydro-3-deoxyglucarate aldolase [Candidatus Rokubacteria bacterium]